MSATAMTKVLRNKTININSIVAGLALIAALVMAVIGITVYGAPVGSLAILTVFFVIYVQIPGLLIVRRLGLDKGHISTALALGIFAGWAFELAIYFLADLLRLDIILLIMGPLATASYFIDVYRGSRKKLILSKFSIGRISPAFCIFMVLTLFYCIVNTQYVYLSPEISDFTYMNPDKAYHMGLINSLSHDYPLMSPWIRGVEINYHVFSEMLLSIPVKFFGVQADAVTLSFGPFLTAYCFGMSYYSFFKEMSSRAGRAGLYALIVILANIYISRYPNVSLAFKFILINDNSSGYGMAACLMTIVLIGKWYDSFKEGRPGNIALLVLVTVFVMLTTGIKGPMGAVTVAALWGTVILGIILRKISPKTLIPLIIISAGFLLVYMVVLGSKGQTNGSGNSIIAFAKITNIAYWKKPLIAWLKSIGIPRIIRLPIILIVFMMFFLSVFFLPFCIGYIRELILVLTGRKEYRIEKVLVYAEFAVGFILMFLLNYSGRSQVYFGLVSAFLAPMIAFWFIEDMEKNGAKSKAAEYALVVCLCVMFVTVAYTTATLFDYFDNRIEVAEEHTDPTAKSNKYMNISREEYEAMEWLEHNTEEDALVAIDRYFSVNPKKYSYKNRWDNRFFLYSVYSNRFNYIAGSGYNMKAAEWPKRKKMIETNKKLYDAGNAERGNLARELDVDYVVVSKRFTKPVDLSNKDYELCFSNEDIDIYKIAS